MSACAIIGFKDGAAVAREECQNSWGGAARIWTALFDKYCKKPDIPYDSWLTRGMLGGGEDTDELWKLAYNTDLPRFERAVLASTFDYATIRQENFYQFANDLLRFDKEYPLAEGVSNHLPYWGEYIVKHEHEAVGFHGTTVTECLWNVWDEETDDYIPYDLRTGDKHFEVYDFLNDNTEPVTVEHGESDGT